MEQQTINSIIKTLCYHEVFSYPLTFRELSRYLISRKKISDRELLFTLSKYRDLFEESRGFIVLRNSRSCIKKRIEKIAESRRKLAKALWISQILSYIPTIQLIGISGSLSMYNAKKDDDIDLFFITSKNSLWVTRFFVVLALIILGQKRKVKESFAKDKICPNMFLTEETLSIQKNARNIYTAHEVVQMKVLYSKNQMKEKFLQSNRWILRYLPHSFIPPKTIKTDTKNSFMLNFINSIFFFLQKNYMRKKITIEIIEKNRAFFHPVKTGQIINKMYNLKLYYRKKMIKDVNTYAPYFLRAN